MTDVTKLKFLSGALREDKQGTYDYMTLLKQGLTALGVTYPSGGGGDSYWTKTGDVISPSSYEDVTITRATGNVGPVIILDRQSDAVTNSEVYVMWIEPPIDNAETMRWEMTSQLSANDTLDYTNHVVKQGFNILNNYPTNAGNHTSMESNWFNGGGNYLEYHYVVSLPDLTQKRLFSSTFIKGADFAASTNVWDFRATSYSFFNLLENKAFSLGLPHGVGDSPFATLSGPSPVFRWSDSVAGNDGDIQYSSSKFLASRTFQVNGQDANGFNVIANNVGGSNGSAGIAVLSNDGNGSALVRMGTAVGGGFAGDFLLTYNSNYPIRIKSNGNFQINGHGQSDNGRNFQIYGNASISTVVDYADDAAAAAGGVPVTGVYRTGSALKIRVS